MKTVLYLTARYQYIETVSKGANYMVYNKVTYSRTRVQGLPSMLSVGLVGKVKVLVSTYRDP